MKVLIKWRTRDSELIERIRTYFGMPRYTTLNGITPADIADEQIEKLKEGERKGHYTIIYEKWHENSGIFIFTSR